jgi:hypothetical protein
MIPPVAPCTFRSPWLRQRPFSAFGQSLSSIPTASKKAIPFLATLPLALVGGIWLLYWLHYDLSVAVGVGFITLAGYP